MRTFLWVITVSILAVACHKDKGARPDPPTFPPAKYLKDKLTGTWMLQETGTAAGPDATPQPTIIGLRYMPPVMTFAYRPDSVYQDTVSLQLTDTTETKAIITLKNGRQYNIEFTQGLMFKLSPLPAQNGVYSLFSPPFLPG